MYNRYIHQPDGSCQRHRVPESIPTPPTRPPVPEPVAPPPPPPKYRQQPPPAPRPRPRPGKDREESIGAFLKNLLPREFDTGDLLVVVLLLLMSGDSREEQNTALLTLALYLFL